MTRKLKYFSLKFSYVEASAFWFVHQYLRDTGLSVKDSVKDSLTAYHYAEAAWTLSAVDLCRTLLQRRLLDLDAIEHKITQGTHENNTAPPQAEDSELQPVPFSSDQIQAFEDKF